MPKSGAESMPRMVTVTEEGVPIVYVPVSPSVVICLNVRIKVSSPSVMPWAYINIVLSLPPEPSVP